MKKKVLALFLATMMSMGIVACGSSDNSTAAAPEVTGESSATPAPTKEASATPEATDDLDKVVKDADKAIQDAADATGTDVTTVDEATDALKKVAQGNGPATMDKYNQIENDMSYDDVKEIMGEEGIETTSAENEAANITVFQWAGKTPGTSASISFQDGKVTAKVQLGLE